MLKRLNGLDFNVEVAGVEGDGPPLLLLHGFTGSLHSWDHIRPALVEFATVIAVDLLGHGQTASPPDPGRYTLGWAANDLLTLLDTLSIDRVDLLGYSMGGRVALHFAVREPHRVRRLILESASPGIEDDQEREARAQADNALAQRIIDRGVPAFVDEWERVPLLQLAPHVSDKQRGAQRRQRLENDAVGLANSLRGMGAGQQAPLWARLSELTMPVQLIVGADDARYTDVARRIQSTLPRASLVIVEGAGHAVHIDQPDDFVCHVKTAVSMPADYSKSTN